MVDFLERKLSLNMKFLLSCVFSTIFFFFAMYYDKNSTFVLLSVSQRFNLLLLFQAMCFIILIIISFHGKNDTLSDFSLICILILLAFLVRLSCLDYRSGDYVVFLEPWVQYYRENNGFSAIKNSLGDYNVTYLYFLSAISYMDINDIYLIKYLSIFFDFILAFYCMKIVGIFFNNRLKELLVFFGVLFLPTVWLNSAYWAQCDSIYSAFAIMSVYYGLKSKSLLCVSFMAISFSFKLQAVFIMPILIVFFITNKLKLKDFIAFPVAYFLTILPAVFLGKPIVDTLLVYVKQTSTYNDRLNLNSPSIFSLLSDKVDVNIFKKIGVFVSFSFVCFLLWVFLKYRSRFTNLLLLLCSLLFCLAIPWLLPFMHERYFFLSDVLSLTTVIILGKLYFVPVLVFLGSYCGYHAFLTGSYILDSRYVSFGIFISIVVLIKEISNEFGGPLYKAKI